MEKYTEQINIRVPPGLAAELREICHYEHTKMTDLVRQLIRERVREVTSTRAYQQWKRRRMKELEEGKEE